MSAEQREPYDDEWDDELRQLELFRLANELGAFADRVSMDYEEGVDDGCFISTGTTDLQGEILTQIDFEAKRVREELVSKRSGELILGKTIGTGFVVRSIVKRKAVFTMFPPEIQTAVQDEYENEYLADSETAFYIGFEQSFVVTDNGEFQYDYELKFYIDDEEIPPAETESMSTNNAAIEIDEVEPVEADSSGPTLANLEALFSDDDRAFFAGLDLAAGNAPRNTLQLFMDQLPAIYGATTAQRYQMIRNIIVQFPIPVAA